MPGLVEAGASALRRKDGAAHGRREPGGLGHKRNKRGASTTVRHTQIIKEKIKERTQPKHSPSKRARLALPARAMVVDVRTPTT